MPGIVPHIWTKIHGHSQSFQGNRIALVLAHADVIACQTGQIEAPTKRITALEAKLGKQPDNSLVPPSQGRKLTRAEGREAKKRERHPGALRRLSETPDRVVERRGRRRALIAITCSRWLINPSSVTVGMK